MENLSMFGMMEDAQGQMEMSQSGNLDVVKMKFSGVETMSWQDLFSGFDTLYAITYSSGIDFVYRLLDLFVEALQVRQSLIWFPALIREHCVSMWHIVFYLMKKFIFFRRQMAENV